MAIIGLDLDLDWVVGSNCE